MSEIQGVIVQGKSNVPGIPQLGGVIPTRTGNHRPVRRKCNVVDLLLVPYHSGDGFRPVVQRVKQIHGKVVTGADQPLDNLAANPGRLFVSLLGLGRLLLRRGRHRLGVVKETGPADKVGRERKVVHPVGVRLEVVQEGTLDGVPDLDRLVVRRRVHDAGAVACAPTHAADAALVSAQNVLGPPRVDGPYPGRKVLARRHQPRGPVAPQVQRLPRDALHPLCVTFELAADLLARLRVPDAHRLVHAACGQSRPVGRPADAQNPAGVALERVLGGSRLCVPYPRRVVAGARSEPRRRRRAELRAEDGLTVARDAVRQPADSLHLENGLRLGCEGQRRLEGVLDAVLAQQRPEVRRVAVDDYFLLVALAGG